MTSQAQTRARPRAPRAIVDQDDAWSASRTTTPSERNRPGSERWGWRRS